MVFTALKYFKIFVVFNLSIKLGKAWMCPASIIAGILKEPLGLKYVGLLDLENLKLISKKKFVTYGVYLVPSKISQLEEQTKTIALVTCAKSSQDIEIINKLVGKKHFARHKPLVIFHQNQSVIQHLTHNISINQHVYTVNYEKQTIVETYSVNGFNIVRQIGSYVVDNPNKVKYTKDKRVHMSTEKKRANFMGLHFNIMAQNDILYAHFDDNYKSLAKFHENNQTYDVTNFASGMTINLLRSLSEQLNFTYSLYDRKDGYYGSEINGKPTGVLANIANGLN